MSGKASTKGDLYLLDNVPPSSSSCHPSKIKDVDSIKKERLYVSSSPIIVNLKQCRENLEQKEQAICHMVGFAQEYDLFRVGDGNKVQADQEVHSSSHVNATTVVEGVLADQEVHGSSHVNATTVVECVQVVQEVHSSSHVNATTVVQGVQAVQEVHCSSHVNATTVVECVQVVQELHSSSQVNATTVVECVQADQEVHSSSHVNSTNVEKQDHFIRSENPVQPVKDMSYTKGPAVKPWYSKTCLPVKVALTAIFMLSLPYSLACSVHLQLHYPVSENKNGVILANTTCPPNISWEGKERIGSGYSVYNPTKYGLYTEPGYSQLTVKNWTQDDFIKYRCIAGFDLACEVNITGSDSGIIKNPQDLYKIDSVCKYTITVDVGSHISYNLQVLGHDSMAQSDCSGEYLELKDQGTTFSYCGNTTLSKETTGHTLEIIFHGDATNPQIAFYLKYKRITGPGNMQSTDAGISPGTIVAVVVPTCIVGAIVVICYLRRRGSN